MALSEIINLSISLSGANPSRPSFGAGMFVAYHTAWPDRVRVYNSFPAVVSDFPTTTSTVYLAAQKFFAGNPTPTTFKVGRRALVFTESWTLTLLDALTDSMSITLEGKTVSCTSSTTTALSATALYNAIVASTISTISTTVSGSVVTVTSVAAGHVVNISGWNRGQIQVKNTTADPGIATDLANILAVDSNFYGFALDSQSSAQVSAAAAWAQTATFKELFFDTLDWDCLSTTTTDIFTTLTAALDSKTVGIVNAQSSLQFSGVALMAQSLVNDPGSYTLDLKALPLCSPDNLSDTEAANAQGKNGNVYRTIAALPLVTTGTNFKGGFEDTARFVDWLQSTMQTAILAVLAGAKKIPYTDKGIRVIGAVITQVLQQGINVGGISDDPSLAPIVILPVRASIAASFINARNLPNVSFQATLAGAIHKVTVTGTLVGS